MLCLPTREFIEVFKSIVSMFQVPRCTWTFFVSYVWAWGLASSILSMCCSTWSSVCAFLSPPLSTAGFLIIWCWNYSLVHTNYLLVEIVHFGLRFTLTLLVYTRKWIWNWCPRHSLYPGFANASHITPCGQGIPLVLSYCDSMCSVGLAPFF